MTDTPRLVLASTSPYRRALLERLGVPFDAVAPTVDEESLKRAGEPARIAARRLAEAKARSIAELLPEAVVIGSDQMVAHRGLIVGKPGTAERAVDQLVSLAGDKHELVTAVCFIHGTRVRHHIDVSVLTMRRLDREAFERYVELDQPLDCAGAYKIEQRGITLFDLIETADSSAITGLPLMATRRLLAEFGLHWP